MCCPCFILHRSSRLRADSLQGGLQKAYLASIYLQQGEQDASLYEHHAGLACALASYANSTGYPIMEKGTALPTLSGTVTDGSQLHLSTYANQWLVIYFYPRDNTPGCTNEAKNFRDLYPEFKQRNVQIIGVSRDSVKSHQNFSEKYDLPFPLLADTDESWCQAFDVIKEKKLYGKTHMGIVRSTFLFNPDGQLERHWDKVKVAGHAQDVLNHIPAVG